MTIPIVSDEVRQKLIAHFKHYVAEGELDIKPFEELKRALDPAEIICLQLNKLLDEDEEELKHFKVYFRKLFDAKVFSQDHAA